MKEPFLVQTPYWPINPFKAQQHFNAIYIGPWCVKDQRGNWTEQPVEVYYQPNPDTSKGHKHYFGLLVRDGDVYITDATSAFSEPIVGIICPNQEVIVSRYRHNFVERNGVFIDGGRDYTRSGGHMGKDFHMVSITADKDQLIMENRLAINPVDAFVPIKQLVSRREEKKQKDAVLSGL